MTDEIRELKKQNAQLRMALAQANSRLLEREFNDAKAELATLEAEAADKPHLVSTS